MPSCGIGHAEALKEAARNLADRAAASTPLDGRLVKVGQAGAGWRVIVNCPACHSPFVAEFADDLPTRYVALGLVKPSSRRRAKSGTPALLPPRGFEQWQKQDPDLTGDLHAELWGDQWQHVAVVALGAIQSGPAGSAELLPPIPFDAETTEWEFLEWLFARAELAGWPADTTSTRTAQIAALVRLMSPRMSGRGRDVAEPRPPALNLFRGARFARSAVARELRRAGVGPVSAGDEGMAGRWLRVHDPLPPETSGYLPGDELEDFDRADRSRYGEDYPGQSLSLDEPIAEAGATAGQENPSRDDDDDLPATHAEAAPDPESVPGPGPIRDNIPKHGPWPGGLELRHARMLPRQARFEDAFPYELLPYFYDGYPHHADPKSCPVLGELCGPERHGDGDPAAINWLLPRSPEIATIPTVTLRLREYWRDFGVAHGRAFEAIERFMRAADRIDPDASLGPISRSGPVPLVYPSGRGTPLRGRDDKGRERVAIPGRGGHVGITPGHSHTPPLELQMLCGGRTVSEVWRSYGAPANGSLTTDAIWAEMRGDAPLTQTALGEVFSGWARPTGKGSPHVYADGAPRGYINEHGGVGQTHSPAEYERTVCGVGQERGPHDLAAIAPPEIIARLVSREIDRAAVLRMVRAGAKRDTAEKRVQRARAAGSADAALVAAVRAWLGYPVRPQAERLAPRTAPGTRGSYWQTEAVPTLRPPVILRLDYSAPESIRTGILGPLWWAARPLFCSLPPRPFAVPRRLGGYCRQHEAGSLSGYLFLRLAALRHAPDQVAHAFRLSAAFPGCGLRSEVCSHCGDPRAGHSSPTEKIRVSRAMSFRYAHAFRPEGKTDVCSRCAGMRSSHLAAS